MTYTAGPDGYQEERSVQENFVQIRSRPAVAQQQVTQVEQVVQQVRPAVQTVVQQTSGNSDADLVARIISQLTPFIRETVTSSLGGSSSTSTTTTTVQQPAPVRTVVASAPAVRTVVASAPAVRTVVAAAPAAATSATASIFGTGGPNNVRVETPDFKLRLRSRKVSSFDSLRYQNEN